MMNRTNQVAVLVSHLGNPFEASLVSHVEAALHTQGYSMILHTYRQEAEESAVQMLAERVDGLLLMGQTLTDRSVDDLRQRGIPLVSLLRPAWEKQGIPSVDLNWLQAMRRTIEYLMSRGHLDIGYMTNGNPAHYHTHRFSMFIQAMQLSNRKFDHANVLNGGGTYLKAYDAMERRIMSGELSFSVLVCANDLMAIGAIAACRHYGIEIPRQLAVVGCEDILMSSEVYPPLTTIQVEREKLSRAAVDMLLAKIRGEEIASPAPTIEGFLVVRASG
jgi:DNA-binding LacI/PurR family transcriptional regulator